MSLNWNFQRGGGGYKTKNPSVWGVWIFSGTTHSCKRQTDVVEQTGTVHPKEIASQEKPTFSPYPFQAFGPIFITVSPARLERF